MIETLCSMLNAIFASVMALFENRNDDISCYYKEISKIHSILNKLNASTDVDIIYQLRKRESYITRKINHDDAIKAVMTLIRTTFYLAIFMTVLCFSVVLYAALSGSDKAEVILAITREIIALTPYIGGFLSILILLRLAAISFITRGGKSRVSKLSCHSCPLFKQYFYGDVEEGSFRSELCSDEHDLD